MTNSTSNRVFQVQVLEQDISFDVGPDQTIVQVAREHGIDILTACEDGQCGTCIVKVLAGEPDHRDRALAPDKQQEGWMCACVSRARGSYLSIEIW